MKLPDFKADVRLNSLRVRMGAPLTTGFRLGQVRPGIDPAELAKLGREGLDVSIDDIQMQNDGTLAYKDVRVVVYIRDVSVMRERQAGNMPRYHVAYCRTLDRMRESNRWQRYVVANREDGRFHINMVGNGSLRSSVEPLSVCQNCLDRLRYLGFNLELDSAERRGRVARFTLSEFFGRYPKSLLAIRPRHDAVDAPLNDYPDDWGEISERYKAQKSYKCERCGLRPAEHHFVHVHHRNGQKNDCDTHNFKCLCLGCHAEEPLHSHMKATSDYGEFVGRYPNWGNGIGRP
jgi:hypothetical protein